MNREPNIPLEEHRSPDGVLCLSVLESADGDISIGFRGSAWHTHGDIEAEIAGLPQADAVRQFVQRIVTDRVLIAIERVGDRITSIWPTDDPGSELKHKPAEAAIEFRTWSGKPRMPSDTAHSEAQRDPDPANGPPPGR